MSWVIAATVTTSVVGGIISSNEQSAAAAQASGQQTAAANAAILEQRKAFETQQELLKPYLASGESALTAMNALVGLGGEEAQAEAFQRLQDSPQFQSLFKQSEDALLQNASATGGLRGGNTQRGLAELRPNLLSGLIEKQLSRLSGLSGRGQRAAEVLGQGAQTTASNIGNYQVGAGQSQAGASLAQGNIAANLYGNIIPSAAGSFFGSVGGPGSGGPIYAPSEIYAGGFENPGGIA